MITNDINIRFGAPCIKNTRISVSDILGYIAGGDNVDTLIKTFPELTKESINEALLYAINSVNNNPSKLRMFT